jgi:hypothetical protein
MFNVQTMYSSSPTVWLNWLEGFYQECFSGKHNFSNYHFSQRYWSSLQCTITSVVDPYILKFGLVFGLVLKFYSSKHSSLFCPAVNDKVARFSTFTPKACIINCFTVVINSALINKIADLTQWIGTASVEPPSFTALQNKLRP